MNSARDSKIGCLGVILKMIGMGSVASSQERPVESQPLPYRVRDDFLSAAERSFYGVLLTALGPDYVICPKVNMADILFVPNRKENQGHVNRIDRKHVDFLICDATFMKPRCVVELDDASHDSSRQRDNDEVKNHAVAAAGLPIVRVKARTAYAIDELKAQILFHLTSTPAVAPPLAIAVESTSVPTCPKCCTPMLRRGSNRGSKIGEKFWGCANYPRCRETIPLS